MSWILFIVNPLKVVEKGLALGPSTACVLRIHPFIFAIGMSSIWGVMDFDQTT